jgi:glyoxylase I family protein
VVAVIKKEIIGVFVYVRDLKAAVKWYEEKLGLVPGDYDYRHFAEMTLEGKYVLHLFPSEGEFLYKRAAFTFDTDDLGNAHQLLIERDVEVTPIASYGDHSSFTFNDPDGNELMI